MPWTAVEPSPSPLPALAAFRLLSASPRSPLLDADQRPRAVRPSGSGLLAPHLVLMALPAPGRERRREHRARVCDRQEADGPLCPPWAGHVVIEIKVWRDKDGDPKDEGSRSSTVTTIRALRSSRSRSRTGRSARHRDPGDPYEEAALRVRRLQPRASVGADVRRNFEARDHASSAGRREVIALPIAALARGGPPADCRERSERTGRGLAGGASTTSAVAATREGAA